MKLTIRLLTGSAIVACLAVLAAHGQAPKPSPAQNAPEVTLQQRVAALEKEVQSLKAELAALRTQIQQSGSTQVPVVSASGKPNGLLPSLAEIQACVNASEELRGNGQILQLEFGTPIISQGGMMELSYGAPKGTTIFTTKIHFDHFVPKTWVFKDSFGTLQCKRVGDTP